MSGFKFIYKRYLYYLKTSLCSFFLYKKDQKDQKDKVEFDNSAVFTYRVDFDNEDENEEGKEE